MKQRIQSCACIRNKILKENNLYLSLCPNPISLPKILASGRNIPKTKNKLLHLIGVSYNSMHWCRGKLKTFFANNRATKWVVHEESVVLIVIIFHIATHHQWMVPKCTFLQHLIEPSKSGKPLLQLDDKGSN